ncbi:DEAD/DEAH box helicase family protein [Micromonospora purpureochromogenes]|uniref:DEAD/DEAH box helicase family protein n=1 Tax=Micromonospora purpureochromogenes TaxID=47872 RepID=UPI00332C39D8
MQGFYTKAELQLLVQRRDTRRPLAGLRINTGIVERYYQQRAIRAIADTFEQGRQREALVVMATGAGKTRTVIALVDLLMRSNWVKRVLSLADRNALVNQAVNAFKKLRRNRQLGHLIRNGSMEVGRLYESPFTEIAPHGPDALFPSDDVDRIISILHSVRATAAPVPEVA